MGSHNQEDDKHASEYSDDDVFADTAVLEDNSDVELEGDLDDELSDEEAYQADGPVDDIVGESSVVFDVDNLVAEFEAEAGDDVTPSSRLRRRLEAIAERKRRHDDLVDFADYDLDI